MRICRTLTATVQHSNRTYFSASHTRLILKQPATALQRVESPRALYKFLPAQSRAYTPSSPSFSSPASAFQSMSWQSIKPSATVTHAAATSPVAWREELKKSAGAPSAYELTKTLVFKPKTAKTATVVPVVVIAREDTETSSAALGKKLNLKELRLASGDLLSEFFSLDKDSRMYAHIDMCDRMLNISLQCPRLP